MAEQMRPASPEQAPDPSNNYERSHPENEAGMGRMDNNKGTPQTEPNRDQQAVKNKQDPRQINAHDVTDARSTSTPAQPEGSMHDEEPTGWDQAPNNIDNPQTKRHPRKEGRGGTP